MKSFNRFLLVTGLALGASCFGASSAMAQLTDDTVTLSGNVLSTLDVDAVDTAAATGLLLQGEGANVIVQIADVLLTTNNTGGITMSTAAAGSITSSTGGTTTIPFDLLSVDDNAAAPADTAFTAGAYAQNFATGFDGTTGQLPVDLYIRYDSPDLVDPGTYGAIVTLTVGDIN